ncbi:MAG: 5-deoxy-glucuronate isomerase [Oscillospiraceae bacterium]|jgi:5-deoxy-glucuronate isomerase|nr:5-deoxy-glucuronate isomerase [Oscillospiraceae bacterium]
MQSNEEFGYPAYDAGGEMVLTRAADLYPNMRMDITVYRFLPGEERSFCDALQESAFLLLEGHVRVNGQTLCRASVIDDPAYCLHVCKGTSVRIEALAQSEILLQKTVNDGTFAPVLYTPESTRRETFGKGQFEGKAQRTVSTFFDADNAPYSNMVCGEILIPQGGWSSYPPHMHPHPEVYYYRFGHPNGFGACFLDDAAYQIRDRSFAAVPGGKYHPQVNAPGYPMMYVWMIRHFEGYPWRERNFQPEHAWLLDDA